MLRCITLIFKNISFWQLSLADVRGDHFVELPSFQVILFLDHALGLECYYKRWRWNCSVSTADRLAVSKLKMWVKYSGYRRLCDSFVAASGGEGLSELFNVAICIFIHVNFHAVGRCLNTTYVLPQNLLWNGPFSTCNDVYPNPIVTYLLVWCSVMWSNW